MTKTSIFQHIPTYTSKKFCLCSTFSHICSHNMSMPTHICLFHQIPIIIYRHISIISYLILPTYSHHIFTNKPIFTVFFPRRFPRLICWGRVLTLATLRPATCAWDDLSKGRSLWKYELYWVGFFFNPHYIYIFIYIYVHYPMIYT